MKGQYSSCNKTNCVQNRWHLQHKHNIQVTKGTNVPQLLFKAKLLFTKKKKQQEPREHRISFETDLLLGKAWAFPSYLSEWPIQPAVSGLCWLKTPALTQAHCWNTLLICHKASVGPPPPCSIPTPLSIHFQSWQNVSTTSLNTQWIYFVPENTDEVFPKQLYKIHENRYNRT